MNKEYTSIPIMANDLKQDAEDINQAIKVYAEDGGTLHSVIPRIVDGEVEGYIIIIDSTNVD